MEKLIELRKNRNWTQQYIADRLGISRPTYTRYETGERDPDFDTLKKISNIFEVSIDYLLGNPDYSHAGEIAAAHIDGDKSYEDLTPEALQQLEDYKLFLIHKYGKKK